MAKIEINPCGYFEGTRLHLTHFDNKPIQEVSIKARLQPGPSRNPFKSLSVRKKKWVPFQFTDNEKKVRIIDLKVSHAASVIGVKSREIRKAAKKGFLEEMLKRSLWISQNIPLPEVQTRIEYSDDSAVSDTDKDTSKVLPIKKNPIIYIKEGLSKKEYEEIAQYILLHQKDWEEGKPDLIYLHRSDSQLPRSIFWIRNRGAFIKLKGAGKEAQALKACRVLQLTKEEYLAIRRYCNQYRYAWELESKPQIEITKGKSGLKRNLMYRPGVGLYIADQSDKKWVFVDNKEQEIAEISQGHYKCVSKAIEFDTGSIVAFGSAGRMIDNGEIISGIDGISDGEAYAHDVLDYELLNKGVVIQYSGGKVNPYTQNKIVKRALISNYCPIGNLEENIKYLTFKENVQIAKDILQALHYLHTEVKEDGTKTWVHLDIKPTNILIVTVKGKKRALLCDFSFTGPVKKKKNFKGGTLSYAAPEILSNVSFGKVGTHTDIWEAGVTLFKLFSGDLPEWAKVCNAFELNSVFVENKEIDKSFEGLKVDENIKQLLKGMLMIASSKRLTAEESLEVLHRLQL